MIVFFPPKVSLEHYLTKYFGKKRYPLRSLIDTFLKGNNGIQKCIFFNHISLFWKSGSLFSVKINTTLDNAFILNFLKKVFFIANLLPIIMLLLASFSFLIHGQIFEHTQNTALPFTNLSDVYKLKINNIELIYSWFILKSLIYGAPSS